MNTPKLSIITINYNNLEGLKRTVESVVNQTYKDFEYIVIDGGSTDGSAAYIESQSTYFDYWVSEPDKGIYNAMNKGILKATGEYLLFLNSGDHFYDLEVLEENHQEVCDADLVCFDLQFVSQNESTIKVFPSNISFSYLYQYYIGHACTFIKLKLFKDFGTYDEDFKIVADWKFFMIVLFKHNRSYKKVDKTITTFYLDGLSSNVKNFKLINEERQQVINKHFPSHIMDLERLKNAERKINDLRNSKKIKLLVKLGLIKGF